MISFRNVLCLALLVPAAAQEAATTTEADVAEVETEEVETEEVEIVEVGPPACEGEVLASVSNGCITSEICGAMAQGMGLQLGSDLYPFEADYVDKGCFYYPNNHPIYPSQAFFGTDGTCSQLRIRPSEGGEHLSCDGSTQAPFDANRCEGDICISSEACQATALAMGLQLGNSLYPFQGPWVVKGCVYFPSNHPEFPNQAYFGVGADICGQLRASPNDGSVRISCVEGAENLVTEASVVATAEPEAVETAEPTEAEAATEEPVAIANVTETVAEEAEPVVAETMETSSPTEMPTTAVPVLTPRPTPVLNTTEVTEVEEEEEEEEDKEDDKEEDDVESEDSEEAVTTDTAPQPAATPNVEEEEVGEAPAISPAEANVQDKNQKTTEDKNDKDSNLEEEEEDEGDFGTGMTVSKLEAGDPASSASAVTYATSFGALVMAWFL